MATRKWHMSQALHSFATLTNVINELTEEEVLAALEIEAAARRRQSIIDRLIARAVRIRELSYATHLKEKYRGSSSNQVHPG